MKITQRAFPLLLLLALPLAAEERSALSLSLGGAAGQTLTSSAKQGHRPPMIIGGRVRYQQTPAWVFGMDMADLSFSAKENGAAKFDVLPLSALAEWHPVRGWTFHPYLLAGAGVARTTHRRSPRTISAQNGALMLGAGVEMDLTPLASVTLEALGRHLVNAAPDGKDMQTTSLGAFLNFYLPDVAVPVQTKQRRSLQDLEFTGLGTRTAQSQEREELQREITQIQEMITSDKAPPIAFERGTSNLLFESFETLDIVGTLLRRHMNVKIRIYGFEDAPLPQEPLPPTENDPSSPTTLPVEPPPAAEFTEPANAGPDSQLPQARAEVVRAYLLTNYGLKPNRLFIAAPNDRPLWAEWNSDGSAGGPLRQMEFEAIP